MRRTVVVILSLLLCSWLGGALPALAACNARVQDCSGSPEVGLAGGNTNVGLVTGAAGSGPATATNAVPPEPQPYRYRLTTPCAVDDAALGACTAGDYACAQPEGRVVSYYIVQRQRLLVDPPVDGYPVPAGTGLGEPYAGYVELWRGCVDVTDLNPGPTPEEVFRFFQTLPLPQLTTNVQPPGGNVLVGLPTIFYTDAPTEQLFTVDIRGFAVAITATAQQFTWHTGDGDAVVTSEGPGAPYPDETVTYDYTSGSYSSYLTVTWGGTYTVNGGAPTDVTGTTTTDGPAVALTALQAHAVLTDPYD